MNKLVVRLIFPVIKRSQTVGAGVATHANDKDMDLTVSFHQSVSCMG